jgi:hypothetical protein
MVLGISVPLFPKLVWFLSHFFLRVDSLGGRFLNVNSFVTPDAFCWGASPLASGTTIGPLLAPVQGFEQQFNHEILLGYLSTVPRFLKLSSLSDSTESDSRWWWW